MDYRDDKYYCLRTILYKLFIDTNTFREILNMTKIWLGL